MPLILLVTFSYQTGYVKEDCYKWTGTLWNGDNWDSPGKETMSQWWKQVGSPSRKPSSPKLCSDEGVEALVNYILWAPERELS